MPDQLKTILESMRKRREQDEAAAKFSVFEAAILSNAPYEEPTPYTRRTFLFERDAEAWLRGAMDEIAPLSAWSEGGCVEVDRIEYSADVNRILVM